MSPTDQLPTFQEQVMLFHQFLDLNTDRPTNWKGAWTCSRDHLREWLEQETMAVEFNPPTQDRCIITLYRTRNPLTPTQQEVKAYVLDHLV